MSSKMQLTGCSRVPWQLWMDHKIFLDDVLLSYGIQFSVDNCELTRKLFTLNRWWILQMSSKMQLTGYSRHYDRSEWFKWKTLTLPCHSMTSHSQLRIANSHASCLPPIDERSFKCLQWGSWRAVPGLWKENSKAIFFAYILLEHLGHPPTLFWSGIPCFSDRGLHMILLTATSSFA